MWNSFVIRDEVEIPNLWFGSTFVICHFYFANFDAIALLQQTLFNGIFLALFLTSQILRHSFLLQVVVYLFYFMVIKST
jgi:hypothetical protein